MLEFHERRKLKQLLYSKVTLLVLGIVVVFLIVSVFEVYGKERQARMRRAEQERVLADLREREEALKTELDRLGSARGIEEEIRSKFEVGREGEGLIVIVDAPDETAPPEPQKGLWERFLEWF